MSLIQYNKDDFLKVKEMHQTSEEVFDVYEDILALINNQLFQNNKYQGNKSGRDWRKKKLPSFLDRHISEEDKLRNSINLELNKLSIDNYRSIFSNIKKILNDIPDNKYTEILSLIIDNVFEKAVIQPDYCPYYVKLVFSLVNGNNRNLIMTLLRNKCTVYHQILSKEVNGNDIEKVSKNQDTEDEDEESNQESDYDEICKQRLRKQYKQGFSQFVGELYNYDIITTREILFFYRKMLSNIAKGLLQKELDEDFIEDNIIYFQKLMEVSVERLINRQKKNTNPLYQIVRNIEELSNGKHIGKVSGRFKFILRDCQDLMKFQLKKRK